MNRPFLSFLLAGRIACALFIVVLLISAVPLTVQAANSKAKVSNQPELELRGGISQPYIVKKGDTLWDIANYFFKQPTQWLKVWEQNIYITNPDLIYPGNKIWFNRKAKGKVKKSGGLTTVRRQPEIRIKPVERLESAVDTHILITALRRQDFILPEAVQAAGYVLDSQDERINYGANDRIYLKFAAPVEEGRVFDVIRTTEPVRDPTSGKIVGVLVKHLGQVRITANRGGIAEGIVLHAFEEISRGDRLKPARNISTRIVPDYPQIPLAGRIIYARNHATEVGQNQIVGINLGSANGLKTGSVLRVLKVGRIVHDAVGGAPVALPEENVGEIIVIALQKNAAIALVTHATHSINLGDAIRNQARR